MSDSPLGVRIVQALASSASPDPRVIAAQIRPTLDEAEIELLVFEALVERVSGRIRLGRSDTASAPSALARDRNRIVWPSDEQLAAEIGDGSFREAARRLGVSRDTLKRRCEARGIDDYYGRRSEGRAFDWITPLAEITKDFAETMRAEGIQVGLEQARVERVCVAGEWKFLADCTADDLRYLGDQYIGRAGSQIERGAYYLAIAEQLEKGGYHNVEALCKASGEVAA